MKATDQLHALGQSLWLDNITRDLLDNGTLERYIDNFCITGLTSNPTIFEHAIAGSRAYDREIERLEEKGVGPEEIFFALAIEDLTRAADLFAPVFAKKPPGSDGFVSLEVSPLLADDVAGTIAAAKQLFARASRQNLLIKIPGTAEGVRAIEETIFAGIPVNVTLLFSLEQYMAAMNAYLRGLERRVNAGLSAGVHSVASLFVSRWDKAVAGRTPDVLRNQLGVAVGRQVYCAYRDMLDSERWQRLAGLGARPQRLLFASTSVKDPQLSEFFYVTQLAAPNTINTLTEATLTAFQARGQVEGTLHRDGGNCDEVLTEIRNAGIDTDEVAALLQREGVAAFQESWKKLLEVIRTKMLSGVRR